MTKRWVCFLSEHITSIICTQSPDAEGLCPQTVWQNPSQILYPPLLATVTSNLAGAATTVLVSVQTHPASSAKQPSYCPCEKNPTSLSTHNWLFRRRVFPQHWEGHRAYLVQQLVRRLDSEDLARAEALTVWSTATVPVTATLSEQSAHTHTTALYICCGTKTATLLFLE